MRTYNDTVIVGLIVSRSETFPVLHTHTHTRLSHAVMYTQLTSYRDLHHAV